MVLTLLCRRRPLLPSIPREDEQRRETFTLLRTRHSVRYNSYSYSRRCTSDPGVSGPDEDCPGLPYSPVSVECDAPQREGRVLRLDSRFYLERSSRGRDKNKRREQRGLTSTLKRLEVGRSESSRRSSKP